MIRVQVTPYRFVGAGLFHTAGACRDDIGGHILKEMKEAKVREILARAGIELNGTRPHDVRVTDTTLYRDIALFGTLGLGDGYVDGKWECDALDVFFEKMMRSGVDAPGGIVGWVWKAQNALLNMQSVRRAFRIAHGHYDLGNDMFELFLGESMGYSSGYYGTGAKNNTEAQYAKFDVICKKLGLRPGMRVLEIGSGWGTFARHAAKNYGISITSLTVSKEQMAYAQKRCAGLPVEFVLEDYRVWARRQAPGAFDRAVSIEMIEAVGEKNFRIYMETVHRALAPGGLFALQAIVGSGNPDAFISTRIFPDGLVPSVRHIVTAAEGLFRLRAWESFGHDYDRTLMAWDEEFRKNGGKIRELRDAAGKRVYDEKFYRLWRYYLLCCAGCFRSETNDVAQIVLARGGAS